MSLTPLLRDQQILGELAATESFLHLMRANRITLSLFIFSSLVLPVSWTRSLSDLSSVSLLRMLEHYLLTYFLLVIVIHLRQVKKMLFMNLLLCSFFFRHSCSSLFFSPFLFLFAYSSFLSVSLLRMLEHYVPTSFAVIHPLSLVPSCYN